jgi:hypothetical protein
MRAGWIRPFTRCTCRCRKEIHQQNSTGGRLDGWMDGWGYLGSQLSVCRCGCICSRPAAQCFFLRPHVRHRLPALFMLPPRAPSTQGMAASSSQTDYPSSPRRRRSSKSKSHAHPTRGKFHRLRIYRQGGRSRSRFSFVFQNSVPLFRLPLNYFSFPTTGTCYSLVYVAGNTR